LPEVVLSNNENEQKSEKLHIPLELPKKEEEKPKKFELD